MHKHLSDMMILLG